MFCTSPWRNWEFRINTKPVGPITTAQLVTPTGNVGPRWRGFEHPLDCFGQHPLSLN